MAKSKESKKNSSSEVVDDARIGVVWERRLNLLREAEKLLAQAPKMLQAGNVSGNWRGWMRKMSKLLPEIKKVI